MPGFSPSPDSPGYQASYRAARLKWGCLKRTIKKTLTATSHPLMGSRDRDHTACFIVALMHCTAETPVPHNLARP